MTRLPSPLRGSWRLRLASGPTLLGLACGGPTTSLDTTPAAITTGHASAAPDQGEGEAESTMGEPPLVLCADECASVLRPTWTHEGPGEHYAVVEMLREADGSLWLGSQRSAGVVGLTELTAAGEPRWSASLGLPCERCELVSMSRHPSGDLLLSVTEPAGVAPALALAVRLDVVAHEVAWVRSLTLTPGLQGRPRAGAVVALDEDHIAQLRVEGYGEEEERIDVLDLDADGILRAQRYLLEQPSSGDGWPLLGVRGVGGELVVAHAWWDAEAERMQAATSRLVPPLYTSVSRIPLPLPLDDLAIDGAGRRLELAHSDGTESVTLLVTSRRSSDPERWSTSLPLLSTSSTRAALAVGPDDDVYVATRITPRLAPGETTVVPTLAIARWTSDGRLRWQGTQPLDIMATFDPIELVVDEDDGVIVGTVIAGRLHVARYQPSCACE